MKRSKMEKARYSVVIIGAGKEGTSLIHALKDSKLLKIHGVVDKNLKAPGIKLARELKIPTSRDWRDFKDDKSLDLIINVTGKEEVCKELIKEKPAHIGAVGGLATKVVSLLLTGHKIAEDGLKESEEKFKVIIENVSDIIFQLTPTGIIQYVNPKVEELYGYKPEGLIGKHLSKTTPISEIPKAISMLKRALAGEVIKKFIVNQLDSKGKLIPVEVDIVPVKRYGKITAIQGLMKNVSDRKKTEQMLKEAQEELELQAWGLKKTNEGIKLLYKELDAKNKELQKLDQLKDDFISTVSHELRTPLAITKEGLSLILDRIPGEITQKQEKILTAAKDNIERLARLINNLLDISKIESGKTILKRKMININDIVKNAAFSFDSKAKAKGLQVHAVFPDKGLYAYADSDKLIQALTNLIGNAMKFTEKGNITISVDDKGKELECVVADTGKGISKEDLPKVFSKFQQFGRTAGAGEKGTGLGLSISKGIVELHKGRIWVDSELDKGTQFIFTLPKYTPESLLKEFIDYGLERSKKTGSDMTLAMISILDIDNIREKLDAGKIDPILDGMEDIIESTLRHAGDLSLKSGEEFSAILMDCDKKSAIKVGKRLEAALENYLYENDLDDDIKLRLGYASYPLEGKEAEELIEKARSL
ncbi:MAG: ATP-binding protein [Candidatus Omnitrophota bacterium]